MVLKFVTRFAQSKHQQVELCQQNQNTNSTKTKSTPVGFEPTPSKRNSLATNHVKHRSVKAPHLLETPHHRFCWSLIRVCLCFAQLTKCWSFVWESNSNSFTCVWSDDFAITNQKQTKYQWLDKPANFEFAFTFVFILPNDEMKSVWSIEMNTTFGKKTSNVVLNANGCKKLSLTYLRWCLRMRGSNWCSTSNFNPPWSQSIYRWHEMFIVVSKLDFDESKMMFDHETNWPSQLWIVTVFFIIWYEIFWIWIFSAELWR